MSRERTLDHLNAVHAKLEHGGKMLSCTSALICRGQRCKAAPAVGRLPTRYISGGGSTCSSDEAICSQSLGLCSWLSPRTSLASASAQQEHAAEVLLMDAWQDRHSKLLKEAHRHSGCGHIRHLELEQADLGRGGRGRHLTETASGQGRSSRQSEETRPAARRDMRSRPGGSMQSASERDIVRPALDETRRSTRRVTDEGAHRVKR